MGLKEKDFYTITELAKLLKISRVSVFKRVKRDSIKGQKMGQNFIIFRKDIDMKKIVEELKKKGVG